MADFSYLPDALKHLHVESVDRSSIRLTGGPDLVAEFARRKMLINMCSISNLVLQCVESIAELPTRSYFESGIKV